MNIQLLIVLVGTALISQGCRAQDREGVRIEKTASANSIPERARGSAKPVESYADVVAKVSPAVVTVRSERRARAAEPFPFQLPDSLRELFGDRFGDSSGQPRNRIQRGLGSGVIVGGDGRCLTNHHVVDGAEDIRVELTDGRSFTATLMGSDPASDLAVLKIDAGGLPVLVLGDSDQVRVGDVALAIGNPLGVGQTVTAGIISAKNRTSSLGEGSFEDFLQTDAAINQGNSGGALVNTAGELIGINSQIVSVSGGNIGIGFAIPSNMARNVMDQLAKNGRVRRGQLGVGIQQLTPELSSAMGLGDRRGVLVNSVTPGSAAERAGIRRGDVIVALEGQPATEVNGLRNRIAGAGPGAEINLTILRDGKEQPIRAKLSELEQASNRGGAPSGGSTNGSGRLGIQVEPITPEIASRLRLRQADGLVVTNVDPAGPAASAGIQQGDVIVEANRQPIKSASDLEGALSRGGQGKPTLLLVSRQGQTFYLTVRGR